MCASISLSSIISRCLNTLSTYLASALLSSGCFLLMYHSPLKYMVLVAGLSVFWLLSIKSSLSAQLVLIFLKNLEIFNFLFTVRVFPNLGRVSFLIDTDEITDKAEPLFGLMINVLASSGDGLIFHSW